MKKMTWNHSCASCGTSLAKGQYNRCPDCGTSFNVTAYELSMTESGWDDPWFNANHLPNPVEEYVAWIDLMGTGKIWPWSLEVASVNIGKLHQAAIEAADNGNVRQYPMNDGLFVTADEARVMKGFLMAFFGRFTNVLIDRFKEEASRPAEFSPVLRAGVAKGDVLHGPDISNNVELGSHSNRRSILMGPPTAKAFHAERDAPPMGVALDASAEDAFSGSPWPWWMKQSPDGFEDAVHHYFEYYAEKSKVGLTEDERDDHLKVFNGYPDLTGWRPEIG